MYNEHSVCEREIEELKEEVEYYKTLFHNEYEARQRNIDELHSRRIKELFEMAEFMSNETNTVLRDLMDSYLKRLDNLRKEKEEATNEEDKGVVEVLIRQCKKMTAELFQTMKRLNVLDGEEVEIGAIKKREYVIKKAPRISQT